MKADLGCKYVMMPFYTHKQLVWSFLDIFVAENLGLVCQLVALGFTETIMFCSDRRPSQWLRILGTSGVLFRTWVFRRTLYLCRNRGWWDVSKNLSVVFMAYETYFYLVAQYT